MSEHPTGKRYWTSMADLEGKTGPQGEFLDSPLRDGNTEGTDGHSRREFIKIMGASLAMLGTSACTRRPVEKIVPYLKKPEDVMPGIANWYASTCGECDSGCGVLVKSREGRPVKFEGNPKHPTSQGALCARGQASVLNVYDPDRLRGPVEAGRKDAPTATTWDQLDSKVLAKIQSAKSGGKIRLLTGEITGPSTNQLIKEFLAGLGGAKHVVYETLGAEEVAAAAETSYGSRVVPHYHFDKADMIVSFGADFLGTWLSPVEFNRGFAKKRKLGVNGDNSKKMSKFVAFESVMTLTGTNADERFRLKSGDEAIAALALAHELIVGLGKSRFAGDSSVRAALAPYAAQTVAQQLGVPAEALRKTAAELWEHRGRGLVLGGGHGAKGDLGVTLEVAVNLLNSALENEGVTIDGTASPATDKSSYPEMLKLIADMKAGLVDVLLIYKSNPAYTLPKSLGFEEALKKVGLVVDFSMFFDETGRLSDVVAATPHHTEAWGDASPYAGLVSVQQPTISPIYQTRSFEDTLMTWARQLKFSGQIATQPNWHEYLKNHWKETLYREHGGSALAFALFWEKALREGFVGAPHEGSRARSFQSSAMSHVTKPASTSGIALVLYPKISLYDGRNANNGWLQEMPDPVTKITWDNYASLSPALAKSMSVSEGDVLRVRTDLTTLEIPAHIQPGMHDQTIAVAVGYGREKAGRVGDGIGVNVISYARPATRALAMSGLPCNPEKTGKTYSLAATQKHDSYEGRPVVREAELKEYVANPKAGNEESGENKSIWPEHEYPGYRWGMAIDMNSCTGCGACVVACQAENNVPTVGKQFVLTSREMHWLRIDRYYSGKAEQPEVVHQPMLCQHCENAPCETVCPVLATVHDHEGLNQQVYNRCVGTRYCANNCPYKVRRFNWFTFTDVPEPQNLQYNPDITVRTRGVMEKCTFCVQRIREGKDRAKDMGIKVKDGDVKSACQQTCPTDAIVFGDLNDKSSRVAKIAADPRGYHVLGELNTRPSITYLTKIRNG
jgi:molybdopterin-containing oxidoreductase family iron-sulfur binding subunit